MEQWSSDGQAGEQDHAQLTADTALAAHIRQKLPPIHPHPRPSPIRRRPSHFHLRPRPHHQAVICDHTVRVLTMRYFWLTCHFHLGFKQERESKRKKERKKQGLGHMVLYGQ